MLILASDQWLELETGHFWFVQNGWSAKWLKQMVVKPCYQWFNDINGITD